MSGPSIGLLSDILDVECAGFRLQGHLNAPFITKVARTTLDETIPLNSLLFRTAAKAVVKAILRIRDEGLGLSERELHSAVVDLLSWKSSHLEFLKDAFRSCGLDVTDKPVIPVLTRKVDGEWACLSDATEWVSNYLIITPKELASCGVAIVTPTLSVRQRQALQELGVATLGRRLTGAVSYI